jgi:hypothetical protein
MNRRRAGPDREIGLDRADFLEALEFLLGGEWRALTEYGRRHERERPQAHADEMDRQRGVEHLFRALPKIAHFLRAVQVQQLLVECGGPVREQGMTARPRRDLAPVRPHCSGKLHVGQIRTFRSRGRCRIRCVARLASKGAWAHRADRQTGRGELPPFEA